MLTLCCTVCALEKVTVLPALSVSTRVPSLTCTLRWRARCIVIASHGVVSVFQSAAGMYRHLCTQSKAEPHGEEAGRLSGFNVDKCRYCRDLRQVERHWVVSARIQWTFVKCTSPWTEAPWSRRVSW